MSSDNDEKGSSDDDTNLGSSGNDDECSSEEDLGHSGTRIKWECEDELRLLAYKKKNKPWDWIYTKFPGRTESTVRQCVSIIKNRGK